MGVYTMTGKGVLKIVAITVIAISIVLPLTGQCAAAYDSWKVYLDGFWVSGDILYLDARNDTVYFATERLITSIDFSDPSDPVLLGNYEREGNSITGVFLRGNLLYVSDDDYYLSILNVVDPSDPYLVGETDVSSEISDVDISGNYAYAATYDGMSVIDISDSSNPFEAAYIDSAWESYAIDVEGDYAYVGAADELKVVNITNPLVPDVIASCELEDGANDITVSGTYAYVVNQADSMEIFDVTDPSDPIRVGAAYTIDEPYNVRVVGGYAYVTAQQGGIVVFDVSTPANPSMVKLIETDGIPKPLAVDGSVAYIGSYREGIFAYDLSTPSNPQQIGFYGVGDRLWTAAVSQGKAYIGEQMPWFRVLDVSDPDNPMQLGAVRYGGGTIEDIAVSGDYVYTIGDSVRIFDVSDSSSPQVVWKNLLSGSAVAISGDYMFAGALSILRALNVSDPTNPSFEGVYGAQATIYDIAISGDYAYLACGTGGLKIVNISNPASLTEAGSYDTPGTAVGIDVSAPYAVVADGTGGLRIIDVSDTTNLVEVGSYSGGGSMTEVKVSGSRAFVVDGMSTLRVIDFSTPSNCVEVGYFNSYGYMHAEPSIVANLVYQADVSYGLGILNVSDAVGTELQSMTAISNGTEATIEWEVSSEEGIERFVLERGAESESQAFRAIASIRANGTLKYTYIDRTIEPAKGYIYKLYAADKEGFRTFLAEESVSAGELPPLRLSQNYPNPFNPNTSIRYYLPERSAVDLNIYNVSGAFVRTLVNGVQGKGYHAAIWDGRDSEGEPVSSGVYFYTLQAGKRKITKKMVLLR